MAKGRPMAPIPRLALCSCPKPAREQTQRSCAPNRARRRKPDFVEGRRGRLPLRILLTARPPPRFGGNLGMRNSAPGKRRRNDRRHPALPRPPRFGLARCPKRANSPILTIQSTVFGRIAPSLRSRLSRRQNRQRQTWGCSSPPENIPRRHCPAPWRRRSRLVSTSALATWFAD